MSRHFRTITAVVEVDDASDLSDPGFAVDRARRGLESAGFTVRTIRNAHNDTSRLPAQETAQ